MTHFKRLCNVYKSRAVVQKKNAQIIYERQTDKKTNRQNDKPKQY